MKDSLLKKISEHTLHVAVIGLGYVGLPLATTFANAGFRVTGIDTDQRKIEKANRGESYVSDIPDSLLRRLIDTRGLTFTSDYDVLDTTDAVFICVPTPLGKTRDPDISYVLSATQNIKNHLHPDQIVILESTTYPGTTDEIVLPELEATGLKVGVDFFLAYSPERIDPGNPHYNMANTPKVVGGVTSTCTELANA